MKYFIDTEFIESGPRKPIQLISIGIVCEDGREMYAISEEFDENDASQWVRDNVLAALEPDVRRDSLEVIGLKIRDFVNPDFPENPSNMSPGERDRLKKPEFWGYYADYDWIGFCQIFGTMMDLPKGFPMYCRDIKQLCDDKGNPKLPEQGKGEHNALSDARWNRQAYQFLIGSGSVSTGPR